jgi:hypothetical protein
MTVSSATSRNEYNGNAATLIFAYTFRILDEDHIAVYVDDVLQTITTHYTVSGVGDSGGGSITFLSAPASGTGNVVFIRNVPVTQETDYVENDPFPAESHEEALDKLTMIAQQLGDTYLGVLRVPIVEGDIGDLPAAASRASKYLAFDADGLPVMTAGTTSSYVVTPFMETVLDDVDASIARSTLGLAIGTNVQAYAASASQGEMEAGTEAALRSMSPLRVAQAISALAGGTRSRQVFTSGTAATYTTPAGCVAISIRMVGGGGGGAAQDTNAGANGVASTWSGGSLSAGGGAGATVGANAGGAGGTAANGDVNISGGAGQGRITFGGSSNDSAAGGAGGNSVFGGGGGGSNGTAGGNAATNSGGGGAGGGLSGNGTTGTGGGAGGYVEKLITSPAATYTYTVGTGGAGGAAGTLAGGNGAAGIIIVDEFY